MSDLITWTFDMSLVLGKKNKSGGAIIVYPILLSIIKLKINKQNQKAKKKNYIYPYSELSVRSIGLNNVRQDWYATNIQNWHSFITFHIALTRYTRYIQYNRQIKITIFFSQKLFMRSDSRIHVSAAKRSFHHWLEIRLNA